MSKERKAQGITVLILAAALAFAAYRKGVFGSGFNLGSLAPRTTVKADPTPQDVIYAMLDAARDGKVKDYLSHYTGQMATLLEKSIAESTQAGFEKYLKDTNAPIKGVALQEPQALTDREVKVRVEYVFQDRNEVQWMYLEKSGNTWKIARVDSSERIKTLVPYGTPVR
ncbi:MAG: hypothetical protein HY820_43395 [Acidobacteria bacterium]|nr:hypothetical protein [Acidobacteriota bacterium]